MQIYKINHNGNEYEFVCSWGNTRNGFKHTCNLFKNGRFMSDATCHYLNRTWECYEYQSVMLRVIGNRMESREEHLKDVFKYENGYEKMTAKRKAEFQNILDADELLNEFKAIMEKLETRP